MIIIGFGNRARHGKDTAVNYIQKQNSIVYVDWQCPVITQRFGFADALYEECHTLHNMTVKDARLLQQVGAARRAEDPNYWITKLFQKVPSCVNMLLISDVRYQNEAEHIKSLGGYLVNVSRLNEDGSPFVADDRPADHPSETELDGYNWDFYIKAKSGQAELIEQQAFAIAEYIRRKAR